MDKHNLIMGNAKLWALASHAERNKVGCIIAKDRRILSTGYNGTLPGRNNLCEIDGSTIDEVMHAEQNALIFCAKHGLSTDGCSIYVTLSPCMHCAKMIIMAGIKKVFYETEYRDTSPLGLLREEGILVEQIKGDINES